MKAEFGAMQLPAMECEKLLPNHQKLVRGRERFTSRFQREHGLADTLISDF